MRITVYCGSRTGKDPVFAMKAEELGYWIANSGHELVYGAGLVGTMGILADAVLDGGGIVTGVTPGYFITAEEIHERLTDLQVVDDLPERRLRMIDQGDAFIALPGGTGTLDEISEVITLMRLGRLSENVKPIMLYNINGYYDHLLSFFDRMAEEDFIGEDARARIHEVCSISDIEEVLRHAGAADTGRNTKYLK
jgi:uncharacterized protein (TIGR00730 family)